MRALVTVITLWLCDLGHSFKFKEAPSPIARVNYVHIYPSLTDPVCWEPRTFL